MEHAVDQFRAFNRAHTRFAAVLAPHYMDTEMGVAEARLLYEIAGRQPVLASELQEILGLDAGYVSRAVKRFEERGWVVRERGAEDARQRPIALLPAGQTIFDALDEATRSHSRRQLESLGPGGGALLGHHLAAARALIEGGAGAWTIRTLRPGDMGAIASRQAILYAEHYGWERPMELLLNDVTTGFLRDFQPGREQCWVAERGGEMLGSVMLADGGDGVAKLRLLYVESWARGLGIGEALVRRCIAFAREAGYARLDLWTHTILTSARRIYDGHGFELVGTEEHDRFGEPIMGETWSLDLSRDVPPATP
ncbi:DNA-binding MarR family transcriptional regulator/ribosomal protein S18 acetylase RimI-like enzyme [Sphingomonas kyeonggiensis]|uniref:bifunctional helix-turn-helix transcriptional regulator/GNAT family N-acetyltransferase n=1 Tax=Sphingomonas kyeonggiensis TaxID=1268553 RepID=UPI002782E070|nr:bifunctional helix-turn-helix transcriptional regulator/GNAT family N-acetyltransferase [Sphingomonas kyeonggiensis]MDQ0249845.1 DNA-binding MarR family transcriptional regulator/ribosomal protein S18 acetylase RimI-like enzyme [Sphingomonas kyeonggiensis]